MTFSISFLKYFRRQLIFGLLFVFLFYYCIINLLNNEKKGVVFGNDFDDMDNMNIGDNADDIFNDDSVGEINKSYDKSLLWHLEVMNDIGNANIIEFTSDNSFLDNDTSIRKCRNSVQDKFLIVDERGYICNRYELSNGCCKVQTLEKATVSHSVLSTKNRYTCSTCNPQGCCTIYEHCVSCCLDPKKIKKKKGLNVNQLHKRNFNMKQNEDILKLRLKNLDRFQLCLAACRTSSESVRENTYINPYYKYCYILQLSNNHYLRRQKSIGIT